MLSPVRPSITWVYHTKTVEVTIMKLSQYGSSIPVVFAGQVSSSQNSNGFPLSRGIKQGWGGKIQPFSNFKHQYLENGSR